VKKVYVFLSDTRLQTADGDRGMDGIPVGQVFQPVGEANRQRMGNE